MTITEPGEVGARIREVREASGISLVQLASRSRLSETVVRTIERGDHEPDLVSAIKLAHSMGLTLGEVVRGPSRRVGGRLRPR